MMQIKVRMDLTGVQAKSPEIQKKTVSYISNQLLRKSSPYVPHDLGNLEGSGIAHSVPEQGRLIWKTPYAHWQWVHGRANGLRGRKWAIRAWKDNKKIILSNAKYIAVGRVQV